jgi:hypothetical protein
LIALDIDTTTGKPRGCGDTNPNGGPRAKY